MKPENIAETILKGSRNIDLMRAEIDCLTKLLISLISANQEELLEIVPESTLIGCDNGVWRLKKKDGYDQSPTTRVIITYEIGGNSLVYSSEPSDRAGKAPMETVQPMYEDLSALVYGVARALPEIRNSRWVALFDAAEIEVT